MIMLVTGGAASGKSEYAEQAAAMLGGNKIYLATMRRSDEEDERRVSRHRALRRGKGFLTVERERDLSRCEVPKQSTVLLECLSNLLSNEMFDERGVGPNRAGEEIFAGICKLTEQAKHLVIVSNEIFSDGVPYGETVMQYQQILGELNQRIAGMADRVVEVVCGIPVMLKQEEKDGSLAVF